MAVAVGRTSVSNRTKTLKVGDQAPDFELPSHRGGDKQNETGLPAIPGQARIER